MKSIGALLARVTKGSNDELAQFEQRLLKLDTEAEPSVKSAFTPRPLIFRHQEPEGETPQKLTITSGRRNAFIRSRTS